MKIALISENSQADKNSIIYDCLKKEATKFNHTVDNYGMFTSKDEHQLTYVQTGLLIAILLNSKAADFVVSGCGNGQGVLLSANSFPDVLCGHIKNPLDAFLFSQVNNGNAISMPFAQYFGLGSEINLANTFQKLFEIPFGGGYPKERVEPQQKNKKILDELKNITHKPLIQILKELDQNFLKATIDYKEFKNLFFANCKDKEIGDYLKTVLNI